MKEDPSAPPFGTWIIALLVAAMATLALLGHSKLVGAPASMRFVEFNQERLDAYRNLRSDREYRGLVVMFGTSALKYATNEEPDFADRVSERVGYPVDVLRIVNNWGVYGDFEPLMQAINELEPDLILLQPELLVTDRPWSRHILLEMDYLKARLRGKSSWDHRNENPENVQFDKPCWRRPGVYDIQTQLERRAPWITVDPDGPDARASRAFVVAAASADIRVALVDVPRRPDLEEQANGARREAFRHPAVATTIRQIESWDPPSIAPELFCDISHVSPAGRDVYSSWLEQRVADALSDSRIRGAASVVDL